MTLPPFLDLDTLPFAGPSPTISGFTMPLPGDDAVPKIDVSGSPTSIPRFLDTVNLLGRTAGLSDCHIIMWAHLYAPPKEEAIWRHCAKAAGDSYSTFRHAILKMYPLAEPVYTLQDLRRIIISAQALSSFTLESFGGFLQDFDRVSGYLLRTGVISTLKERRMFIEGIPHAYHRELEFSLRLADPHHATGIPWPTETVADEIWQILQVQLILSHRAPQAIPVEAYYASTCPPVASHVQNPLGVYANAQNQLPTPSASSFDGTRSSPVIIRHSQAIWSHPPMPADALTTLPALRHAQLPTPVMPLIPSPVTPQAWPTHFSDAQECSLVSNMFRREPPATPAALPAKGKTSADVSRLQNITPISQAYTQAPVISQTFPDYRPIPGTSLISAAHAQFYQRPDPGVPAHLAPSAEPRQSSKHPPAASQALLMSPACIVCGHISHQTTKCLTRSFLLNSGITVADMCGRLMQPDGRPFTSKYPGACILDRLNHYFTRNVNMIPLGLQTPILPISDDQGTTSAAQELPPSHRRKPPRQWGAPQDIPGTGYRSQAKTQASTTPTDPPNAAMLLERPPDKSSYLAIVQQVRKVPSPFGTIIPKATVAIPDDPDEPIQSPIQYSEAQRKAYRRQALLTNAADGPPPWKPPAGFPKTSDKPLAPAVTALHEINVRLNDKLQVNGVLDSGSSFIGIPRRIWQKLKSLACFSNPTYIHTASANPSQSSHIIPSVKISVPGFSIQAPIHIQLGDKSDGHCHTLTRLAAHLCNFAGS